MWVLLNGKFIKESMAKVSVFDHGFLYGDGVYDTLRTYNGKIWRIREHINRFQKSAKRLGLKVPYSKKRMEKFINEAVKKNGFKESRIRLTMTRGINSGDFNDCKKATFLIQCAPLKKEPNYIYKRGVDVITIKYQRIAPEAKTISLLPMVLAHREMHKKKAYEAIYTDCKKYVREGTVTNIFIIKKETVITPKNEILHGTTRDFIIELAKRRGLKVKIKDIKISDLYSADEAFITNAPRKIVPVRRVDRKVIGKGVPGRYTKLLMKSFDEVTKNYF